jgi:hypothetical protein
MITAALELAALGWPVFPCDWRPGEHEKAPLVPKPGFHLATTDPAQIKTWWRRWPKAMIGAKVPAAYLVLDIDPRKSGSREQLEQLAGPIPITLIVWSGRNDGGCRLYFHRPAGPLTSTPLPTGIDLKANGYVIVPPSIHPVTDEPYRWEHHPVAVLPHTLQELLRFTPAPRMIYRTDKIASGAGLLRKVAEATEGNRNNSLFWAACRAGEDGILDQIEDQLIAAAMSAGET